MVGYEEPRAFDSVLAGHLGPFAHTNGNLGKSPAIPEPPFS